jgi:hypothetical protein
VCTSPDCGNSIVSSILRIFGMTIVDDAKGITRLFTEHKWATLFVLFLMITLPTGWAWFSKSSSKVIDNRGSNGGVFVGRDNNGNINISTSRNQVISAQPVSINRWDGEAYEHKYQIVISGTVTNAMLGVHIPADEGILMKQTTSKLDNYQATTTADGKDHAYSLVTVYFKSLKPIKANDAIFDIAQ